MVAFGIFSWTVLIKLFLSQRGWGMGEGFTKCNRCSGMMFYEKIYYGTEHFWVWKCVYCGEYIDQVILENRLLIKTGGVPNTRNRKRLEG
jgi:hypothetical protein